MFDIDGNVLDKVPDLVLEGVLDGKVDDLVLVVDFFISDLLFSSASLCFFSSSVTLQVSCPESAILSLVFKMDGIFAVEMLVVLTIAVK